MQYVLNPTTGEVRYVTQAWARWLKSYGWERTTFDEYLRYERDRYWLKMVNA